MASASITKRGQKYVVRYRLGGRAYPIVHAGSFDTKKDAEKRLTIVKAELALGRNPGIMLDRMRELSSGLAVRFADVAERYRLSRVDVAAETRDGIAVHVRLLDQTFGDVDPAAIRWQDVQEWIASLTMKPGSVRRYLGTLKLILDYCSIDPNPARDGRVKLPKMGREDVNPPSAGDVDAMQVHISRRYRLAFETLSATGMRVGELYALLWRDVDIAKSRFRVRHGKSAAARRWVAVPSETMTMVCEETPPDDRVAERPVFLGGSDAFAAAMRRACVSAEIAHYHPHDLRHRYASVQIDRGVPVTTLAAQLGHSKKSLTLDTYSHVLLDD